jgi:hypothetical protein
MAGDPEAEPAAAESRIIQYGVQLDMDDELTQELTGSNCNCCLKGTFKRKPVYSFL